MLNCQNQECIFITVKAYTQLPHIKPTFYVGLLFVDDQADTDYSLKILGFM